MDRQVGNSERVWRELKQDKMMLSEAARTEMLKLISDVRSKLHGNGNGIQQEQQEYIGEAMCGAGDGVISNLDFRSRLFDTPGWETYKGLLRFYADFQKKIDHEVPQTLETLRILMKPLKELRTVRDVSRMELFRRLSVS